MALLIVLGLGGCSWTREGRLLDDGDRSYAAGDLDGALRRYREALEIAPRNARALYSVGIVHYSRKDYPRALEMFDRALEIEDCADYRLQRGHTRVRLGKLMPAIEDYRAALRLDPSRTRAYYSIGIVYYDLRNYDEAVRWLERYLEASPKARDRERVESLIRSLRQWAS